MAAHSIVEIIAKKQAGKSLTADEIAWFVQGSADGTIPDYQISALLMAIYFRGMTLRETGDLTAAMIDSGKRLHLRSIRDYKVDKHSTGGVGDKISLIVGPLVASAGVAVPMVSGRALGHTGGTLDKLEAIPGLRTSLTPSEFERVVKRVGISIIGQTDEIAPADRKFYSIRDVTSTIACPPLMVSSILSKKIASGAEAVVFDIKCGRGAFIKTVREAHAFARLLIKVGTMLGIKATAILTRMDEPLGYCIGNAIEVREAIEVLRGKPVQDLVDVTMALGAEMLLMARKTRTRQEAYHLLRQELGSGRALEKFKEMIVAQGGEGRVTEEPERLKLARTRLRLVAPANGFVATIDALEVGRIATMLGAGRLKKEDRVDHAVGIEFLKRRGDRVRKGETIAIVYAARRSLGKTCLDLLGNAITIGKQRPRPSRTVIGKVEPEGIERLPLP